MSAIPRERTLDSSFGLLAEGYTFASSRARRYGSDVFWTRLLGRPALVAFGEDAAGQFYDPDRFTRRRALPPTTLRLLQDKGSVQWLDGDAHRRRKQMFLAVMTPAAIAGLSELMAEEWRARIPRWQAAEQVTLFFALRELLCAAVLRWTGLPAGKTEVARRTRQLAAMIDGAGSVGPRLWWGLLQRGASERWARGVLADVRAGRLAVPEGSPVDVVASHRDVDGALLHCDVAAVELLNLLRPTVAVARFITFLALALHRHPEWLPAVRDDDEDRQAFVQEVRRFYPFFPLVGGRARTAFEWRGERFATGTWMLLDLYATNRDPRLYDQPEEFRPQRFHGRNPGAFTLVPQGGGDFGDGHRCAGEWLTIEPMRRAARLLTTEMRYEVPDQDLGIDLGRMPAVPRSRFAIRAVRPVTVA